MDEKNEFIKKKKNRRILSTILFYLIILLAILLGIVVYISNYDGIGIYTKTLIDFDSKPSEMLSEKGCVNGVYIFRIVHYAIALICLIYLPIFLKQLKNRFYNNNNLILTDDELYGTNVKLFKVKEFAIRLEDLKQIKIKRNILKSFFGRKKLILVTSDQIIKIYFIKDIKKVYERIDTLAKQKNAVYDLDAYKKLRKKPLNDFCSDIKKSFNKIFKSLGLKDLFDGKSNMEIKLEKIKSLKNTGKITDDEYEQLREKIIKEDMK